MRADRIQCRPTHAALPDAVDGHADGHAECHFEQRDARRYTLLLRQAKLCTDAGEFLCVIRDVSESGVSIRTFHPLPPGKHMAIELREGCPWPVEKIWERGDAAGFRLSNRVALDDMLADDARYPRRPFRIAISLPVTLHSGLEQGTGTLHNLSQQGARIEADRQWARDRLVRLSIAHLPPVHAKVRWRRDRIHGLVFEDRYSFRDFALALARLHGIV